MLQGVVGGKGRKLDRGRCWSPDLTELKKIWGRVGVGGRRQAILPLSIVLNNHCFVWMLLEGVRNCFVKQYRDLTTLEKNSDSLRSLTSSLHFTYILMVPKPLCFKSHGHQTTQVLGLMWSARCWFTSSSMYLKIKYFLNYNETEWEEMWATYLPC